MLRVHESLHAGRAIALHLRPQHLSTCNKLQGAALVAWVGCQGCHCSMVMLRRKITKILSETKAEVRRTARLEGAFNSASNLLGVFVASENS
jgi:Fe-S cluster biogenesis protein NfuA